jgi:serine phosphatase RsbU (regulator of sigma subunit)
MSSLEPLRQLLRQSQRARPEDLPEMAMQAAPMLGASVLVIYLIDHQQRLLIPLLGGSAPDRGELAVDGTLAGRAFSMQHAYAGAVDTGGARLWVPLLDGSERMGVLEVVTEGALSEPAVEDCVVVAALLADTIVTRELYSDTIERLRRREPMQLAAEMLRAQLPPLTFATNHVVISGILEPSYDVAGDAFDYAVNGDTAHLALFDAAGHGSAGGMRAVILASIALAGYRNARRAGKDLLATYHHIDAAVRNYDRAGIITAVLAELDQRTGTLEIISAGHPSGMIMRRGKVVTVLPTPTALPVGLGDRRAPRLIGQSLEPGDRLLLYTDGLIERRGETLDVGLEALAARAVGARGVDELCHAVVDAMGGANGFEDDVAVIAIEVRGGD